MKPIQDGNIVSRLPVFADRRGTSPEFASAPVQLDYVQATADVAVTAGSAAAAQVVLQGNSVNYGGNARVLLEFFCPSADFNGNLIVNFWVGSLDTARVAQFTSGGGGRLGVPVCAQRVYFLSGANSFSVRAWTTNGTPNLRATPTFAPMFMRVTAI